MNRYAPLPEDVHEATYRHVRKEFDSWWSSEANPAYKRLLAIEQKLDKIYEAVQILDGTRNRQSLPKSALRVEDLRHLTDMPSTPPTARRAGAGTITEDQYNALLKDVQGLYSVLGALGLTVRRRSG